MGYSQNPMQSGGNPFGTDPYAPAPQYNQTSYGGPSQFGQQGGFGPPPSSFNFKIPIIIGSVLMGLIVLIVVGLIGLNVARRAMSAVQVAQARLEQEARSAQAKAEFEAHLAKVQADQEARNAQFRADHQANLDRMRSMNSAPAFNPPIYNSPPPAFMPPPTYNSTPRYNPTPPPAFNSAPSFMPAPSFTPAPNFNSAPSFSPSTPQVEKEEPPPGFPATDMAQYKPKDIVYVQSGRKWYPALVLAKRGKLTNIRYVTNGNIEMVILSRIRLEKDPDSTEVSSTKTPGSSVPKALKPAGGTNTDEGEVESPTIVKPDESGVETEVSTPALPPAATKVRIWTDATGQFKIEAELLSCEFDHVQLKRTDGKIINMPLIKLSEADQAIVREKFP